MLAQLLYMCQENEDDRKIAKNAIQSCVAEMAQTRHIDAVQRTFPHLQNVGQKDDKRTPLLVLTARRSGKLCFWGAVLLNLGRLSPDCPLNVDNAVRLGRNKADNIARQRYN